MGKAPATASRLLKRRRQRRIADISRVIRRCTVNAGPQWGQSFGSSLANTPPAKSLKVDGLAECRIAPIKTSVDNEANTLLYQLRHENSEVYNTDACHAIERRIETRKITSFWWHIMIDWLMRKRSMLAEWFTGYNDIYLPRHILERAFLCFTAITIPPKLKAHSGRVQWPPDIEVPMEITYR